ncbi:hypothetical protein FVB9532_03885 [Mesonia oceanica]|uniref:Uncharacterized protein n=1 Tax=Mesonia oceanica TaxID=2687242 RepID=A0AC61YDZ7_9FLAO|nr:hypothetical protein FVB9532_03885 [Mesonia oceanica]
MGCIEEVAVKVNHTSLFGVPVTDSSSVPKSEPVALTVVPAVVKVHSRLSFKTNSIALSHSSLEGACGGVFTQTSKVVWALFVEAHP